MSADISLQVKIDYKQTVKNLNAFKMGISSPQIRANVAEVFLAWIQSNFRVEGRLVTPLGWPPLSKEYEKIKAKGPLRRGSKTFQFKPKGTPFSVVDTKTGKRVTKYAQDVEIGRGRTKRIFAKHRTVKVATFSMMKILQLTGKLKGSFSQLTSTVGRPVKGDTRVIIGSHTSYAHFHELDGPRRVIPQRKMLPTRAIAKKLTEKTITAFVQAVVNKHKTL